MNELIADTLFKAMRQGMADYENKDRKKWVLDHIGQVICTVSQIMWTSGTETQIS